MLCDAEPGGLCFENRPEGTHYGRGFSISTTHPGDRIGADHELRADENLAERCLPTVDSGPAHSYRSRCLGCGERGSIQTSENAASEDAHDHAFAGWRDLPAVPRPPSGELGKAAEKAMAKWRSLVDRMLPVGWLEAGGPIRTYRQPKGGRHVPGGAPGGGYDLSAGVDPLALRRAAAGAAAGAEPALTQGLGQVEMAKTGEQLGFDLGL